jgi:hypothetical protein
VRNKCGVFAADTHLERGAFTIQNASIKIAAAGAAMTLENRRRCPSIP